MGLSFVDSDDLRSLADAIRAQTSDSNDMVFPGDFITQLNNIGGLVSTGDLEDYFHGTLTDLIVPDGTQAIRPHLFKDNTLLETVVIPSSVSSIDNVFSFAQYNALRSFDARYSTFSLTAQTFQYCDHLEEVYLNAGTSMAMAPRDNLSGGGPPNGYPVIFSYLNSLETLSFAYGTRSGAIRYLCAHCDNLTSITLPNGITTLGDEVVISCPKLTSITIPASVTELTETPFYALNGLETITFTGTPSSIDQRAFAYIYSTKSLVINVPWSVGDVSGAPWGASSATINYNYTP